MDDTSEITETEESQPNTNDVYHTMFADYPDIVGAEQLCEMLGCDEAVVVFCFDKEERSFAVSANYNAGTEYAVVYGSTAAEALAHEICHIFGAYDYYFPSVIDE